MKRTLDTIFTVQEAAAIKQVDQSSVRRALLTGRLKGEHKGKVWLITARDLDAWIPERRGRQRPLTGENKEPQQTGICRGAVLSAA